MGEIEDQLAELLGDDDLAAECPRPDSPLRRPEPVRLPVAEAIRICGRGEVLAAYEGANTRAVAMLESGHIAVLDDVCPHDGGLLSDGFVEGERVVCARHGWEFDGHTGRCHGREQVAISCRIAKPPHI